MAKYDINDPTDIAIMEETFNDFSYEEWCTFADFAYSAAHKANFTQGQRSLLGKAKSVAGRGKRLSAKQLSIILNTAEKIEEIQEDESKNKKAIETLQDNDYKVPLKHLTMRVAWHDNKWNGSICNDPENNNHCSGFHSLLSERIRKRKDENIDKEIEHRGKPLKDIDYLPPCFWSINLFGNDPIKAIHDNPAAPALENIEEELAPKSMYSWPFALSFTRSQKEVAESGAYPKNLEETRIPRFSSKVYEGESIAFMYANKSNPFTEEEGQYLVVGAGIVDNRQNANDIPRFGPQEIIDDLRKKPRSNFKARNFPRINFAMQFGFNDNTAVRMPYHEYLDAAENLDNDAKEGFFEKIKVAITEPELEWCFKYVAMDIGDDETIYILTKMRKALISCKDDGVVPRAAMQERIEKIEDLLQVAYASRSYFPGFSSISRVLLNQSNEPQFDLEDFYEDFKIDEDTTDNALREVLLNPRSNDTSKKYASQINELKDRIEQHGFTIDQFLQLSLLNLKPFQFQRILSGKIELPQQWLRNFDDDVKASHRVTDIIKNPYLLYEDYDYWADSHDDVYGEELDAPIDLFKIDIAYFPDTRFVPRLDLQRTMSFIDKRRIRALILRHLNTLENRGDCFTNAEKLQEVILQYPLFYEIGEDYNVPADFFYPIREDYANHFQEEPKKIVLVEANDTMYYYLSEVYEAEENIEKCINTLLQAPDNIEIYPNLENRIHSSVMQLTDKIGTDFDGEGFTEEREKLYTNLFKKKLFVVSGSAGSGKSFEVLHIIDHLEKKENQKYLLLAPTGKAALRLSADKEFENIDASTIDKFINGVKHRKISQSQVRQYKNIIIDETSMVDLLKFDRLLQIFNFKEPSFKRLILIGDPNQLPAIGYGRVLADLISYLVSKPEYNDNFIQLETNCRSELMENEVLTLAEAFKASVKDDIETGLKQKLEAKEIQISEGFRARYWSNKDELFNLIKEEFNLLTKDFSGDLNEKLNQILGLSAEGDIINQKFSIENFQILSPYNSQYSGASKINDFIQSNFKKKLPFELRKNLYKDSDKLIRTQNYYEKKKLVLSNGTLGLIKKDRSELFYYESQQGLDDVSFYDIRKAEQEFFELAYAITIHKSQGSGFNHLFLVLPARYGLLSKELVYTALTRTKKSITLFIQSNVDDKKSVLDKALERSFSSSRWTSLLLDKPYRFYDLEPEKGVFVESRIELLIYHVLMKKREELGKDTFNFSYEEKPVVDGNLIDIKTDFTIYCNSKEWYWEHLGLLGQRKYSWTWKNLKTKRYQEGGIWEQVITTDERNGISPIKIENLVAKIIEDNVDTEDKNNQYSNHHFYLR